MSDEFLGQTTPQSAESNTPVTEAKTGESQAKAEYSEFLQAITNAEGKPKYKTVADALIGAAKAQEHIARIEAENAELRGVAKKVETLEQVLARLDAGKTEDHPVVPKFEDQEKLVLSVIEKQEAAKRDRSNRESVLNALTSQFGEKAQEMLATKARELGLSVSDLGEMAAKSPQAVLSYFKMESKGTPSVPSTVNTQAFQPSQGQAAPPENVLWGADSKQVIGFWRQLRQEITAQS